MPHTQDLNQLTISGRVRSAPQLHRFDDGDTACTFVLTHSTDHYQTGDWELQYYNVSVWGQAADAFADSFQTDQWIVVTGRLDAVYDQTLTGYQPIVSIIADRIITTDPPPDPAANTAQRELGEQRHTRTGR
jgi:single-stranded DNA-binding protein